MPVICRKFLLKLALRTFLKRSHAGNLSIWTDEIKAKSEEKPRKQQLTVTLSDYKHLAHVIVLWQIQKFICYCTVFALFYSVFESTFQVQAPEVYIRRGDLTEVFLRYEFEGFIFGGAQVIFGILRYIYRSFKVSRLKPRFLNILYQ